MTLEFEKPSSVDQPIFSANKNETNQTGVVTNVFTKVTFTTERFDIEGAYDAPNSKYIAPFDGKFWFFTHVKWLATADQDNLVIRFYFNGSPSGPNGVTVNTGASGTGVASTYGFGWIELSKDDYVEVYVRQTSGSDKIIDGGTDDSRFECVKAIPN